MRNIKTASTQSGMAMFVSILVAVVVGSLVLTMAQTMRKNSLDQVYFESMYKAYRIAESGLNEVMGELAVDPNCYLEVNFSDVRTLPGGEYYPTVSRVNFPGVNNGYYVIINATSKLGGGNYGSKLHAYAQVSNVGDYFAAVKNDLVIAPDADISSGKIYATDLTFLDADAIVPTKVKKAEYVVSSDPTNDPHLTPPLNWSATTKSIIQIAEPGSGQPVELPYPLLFPELLDSDVIRYVDKAHANPLDPSIGHHKCDFRNDLSGDGFIKIYPPGYVGTQASDDDYDPSPGKHTFVNEDHIYFCEGDMFVEGEVHGQVLLVATGDIYITGNLTRYGTQLGDTDATMPGNNNPNASSAHQIVLMTRNNVRITASMTSPATQTIEALVLAPHGTIIPDEYADTADHAGLSLVFNGAMILDFRPILDGVFQNTRTYSYMDSLRTNPPPDLPALSQVFYSMEETLGQLY